jgi:hypothetical protein
MKRLIMLAACLTAFLAVPGLAGAQTSGHRRACSVQHHFLGARSNFHWWRGTSRNPADESLKTTTYAYGSGSCARIAFRRWTQLMNLAFGHFLQGHGSLSAPGIRGTWRHIRTVQVPNTCEGDGSSSSTPYGVFGLRISNLSGRLLGTGTAKLRLAC